MEYWIKFLFLVILLTSCKNYKEITVSGIESFQVKKIDKNEMVCEIGISIKNPNNFSFKIYSGKARIYMGNIILGHAQLLKKAHVPANSFGHYKLLLKTSFEKMSYQDVLNRFSLSDFGKIKINGQIKVGKFLFRKKIDTEYEGPSFNILDFWRLTK